MLAWLFGFIMNFRIAFPSAVRNAVLIHVILNLFIGFGIMTILTIFVLLIQQKENFPSSYVLFNLLLQSVVVYFVNVFHFLA